MACVKHFVADVVANIFLLFGVPIVALILVVLML